MKLTFSSISSVFLLVHEIIIHDRYFIRGKCKIPPTLTFFHECKM